MATLNAKGRVLEVDLQGDTVRAATGSMIAYTGRVDFKAAGMGGGDGFMSALKRAASGENLSLMEVSGTGRARLAKDALMVEVIDLQNDTLSVESDSILAVTPGLKLDIKFAGLGGAMSGQGIATTTVSGNGQVAVLSDGPMIVLQVQPGQPLVVDPQAFIASSGQVSTSIVPGISWRNLVGEGSGEAFSMRFEGSGRVLIQPAER